MWIYMILCHLFTGITIVLLVMTGYSGHFHIPLYSLNHPAFALLCAIVYFLTETMIIFFFIATGKEIKEYFNEELAEQHHHEQSKQIKRKVFPSTVINIFLVMVTFIIGGAVDTGILPSWIHGILFLIIIIHFIKVIVVQNTGFRENAKIMVEIAGKGELLSNQKEQ